MESIVILLTGTINASNIPNLKMTDAQKREDEYFKSIKKWLALPNPVVFCENSNYNSEKINSLTKGLSSEKFEYLKFTTTQSYLGKGHGEAEIIEFAFKNSQLLKGDVLICKSTGKNYVINAKAIINKMSSAPYCFNMVTAIMKRSLTFADSRFFFFEKQFYYTCLLKNLDKIDEQNGIYFEHILARSIHCAMCQNKTWNMLPELPFYEGYYGSDGTRYNNFVAKKIMKKLWYLIVNKTISSNR
jgi:hypothetical protein